MAAPRHTTTRDRHRAAIARKHQPCGICGKAIDYDLKWPDRQCFVVDHIVPLNHGGTDTLDNKQAAHSLCNLRKSDRLDGGPVIRRSASLKRPPGEGPPTPGRSG